MDLLRRWVLQPVVAPGPLVRARIPARQAIDQPLGVEGRARPIAAPDHRRGGAAAAARRADRPREPTGVAPAKLRASGQPLNLRLTLILHFWATAALFLWTCRNTNCQISVIA